MTPNMRVLAIDPGYDRLGVAIMEKDQKHGTLLYSSCVVTNRADSFPERLQHIGAEIRTLCATYDPTAIALERLYFNTNQKTVMQVAEVRGVVIYLAGLHGCRMLEYTPQEVKVAVTGYGKSDKKQVTTMVARLLPGVKKDALDDEYDAIAIALTAIASAR